MTLYDLNMPLNIYGTVLRIHKCSHHQDCKPGVC